MKGIFSTRIASSPFMRVRIVADMPEPPPPTITTSVVSSSFLAAFLTATGTRVAGSTPACFTQSATALRIAVDVIVAPVKASMLGDCASTILEGRISAALEPIPSVSVCLTMFTFSMRSFENVTSTTTGP